MLALDSLCSRWSILGLKLAVGAVVGMVLFLGSASLTHAQATRTWVSGVGDDVNPCSRTAPCKTFGGAISKTAAGGEINALDPGGFGVVTITKSITIDGSGTFASILASGTNAIIVNAGVNDTVIIKGLSINGATNGLNGIRFLAGRALFVEDTTIEGFLNAGIDSRPSTGGAALYLTNVNIREVGLSATGSAPDTRAALLADAPAGMNVVADRSRFEGSRVGVSVGNNIRMVIRDSLITNNAQAGFAAQAASAVNELNLENVTISFNGTGIITSSSGPVSTVRISNVTVVDNNVGIQAFAPGVIVSFGNNQIGGNNSGNGPPTSTIPRQ